MCEVEGTPFSVKPMTYDSMQNANLKKHSSLTNAIKFAHGNTPAFDPLMVPRGGDVETVANIAKDTVTSSSSMGPIDMVVEAVNGLKDYIKGPKADTLLLLFTTALNNPLCQKLQVSPILGFLLLGLLFGPNGKNLIKDIHTTEMMADLGIVLFLFEMGIHLDIKTLMAMKKDVFGIGLSQFSITGIVIGLICMVLNYSGAAAIIIGWSLALSSSAFVLQVSSFCHLFLLTGLADYKKSSLILQIF
jgi:hypothetical protein